jgi:hypothetical protein
MRLLVALFLIFLSSELNAQATVLDQDLLIKSVDHQNTKFQEFVNTSAPLYNGSAYIKYWNKVIGHPYFNSDQFKSADIKYQNFIYRDIPLKYDLMKNQLVILNATKEFEMAIINNYVSEFKINNHSFIKINSDSVHVYNPGQGFYELLYNGNSSVLAKYYKRVEASLKAEDNTSSFIEYDKYFVFANNEYHEVERISDYFSLHKDQKGQLKKYLRKEKLNYAKDPAKALVSLATYFDTLSHE